MLFLVDGRAGLLPDDEAIARELRRAGKRVLVVVNKAEGREEGAVRVRAPRLRRRPLRSRPSTASGIGDLLDAALAGLPQRGARPRTRRVAICASRSSGRPNVGKSSLLNRLLGRERAVVSAIPGTTRDSVDSLLERKGRRYLLRGHRGHPPVRLLKENVDHVSVVQARRAIERADVAMLVLDAEEGLREMDATIGGEVAGGGRAASSSRSTSGTWRSRRRSDPAGLRAARCGTT